MSEAYFINVFSIFNTIKSNSILQTQSSDRGGHEARHGGMSPTPLDQHIEGGYGAREAGVERRPAPVHDLLKVHHARQHRQHRLNQ